MAQKVNTPVIPVAKHAQSILAMTFVIITFPCIVRYWISLLMYAPAVLKKKHASEIMPTTQHTGQTLLTSVFVVRPEKASVPARNVLWS